MIKSVPHVAAFIVNGREDYPLAFAVRHKDKGTTTAKEIAGSLTAAQGRMCIGTDKQNADTPIAVQLRNSAKRTFSITLHIRAYT